MVREEVGLDRKDMPGPTRRATIRPMSERPEGVAGTLYLVGTPIGNLGDMTERARATLASVDLVAAEDTRRTRGLLSSLGVRVRMVSFHDASFAAHAAHPLACRSATSSEKRSPSSNRLSNSLH